MDRTTVCRKCTHFVKTFEDKKRGEMVGRCRRFPPQVVVDVGYVEVISDNMKQVTLPKTSQYPAVMGDDTCGEFKRA